MKKNLLKNGAVLSLLFLLFAPCVLVNAQSTKIGVIADIHFFDPELLISNGSAFQTYLAYDRKLLQESQAILESVIDSLIAASPAYVFVAGDLTKDGEKSGHEKVANYFQQLEDAGIEVIITPGNHDVNNPHAVSFDGDNMTPVESVTPEQFASIYGDFGFNQAQMLDTASLSFVYNLTNDITVISMDVCRYDNNMENNHPTTSGGFKPQVLDWVIDRIEALKTEQRTVVGIMHHGLVEHYAGQKDLFSEYVIDNWDSVSTVLADAGMQVVFTGHYHAQDMALKRTEQSFILDIETGSTVTYPNPYRFVTIENGTMSVAGRRIENIDFETGELTFQEYALDFIEAGLPVLVKGMLMSEPYNLPDSTASMMEPAITESFIAHYSGNEGTPTPQTQGVIDALVQNPDYSFIGYAMQSIWNDPKPDDWHLELNLSDGNITTLDQHILNNQINIYPNPAENIIHIDGLSDENTLVRIISIDGTVAFEGNANYSENTIYIAIPSGFYVLELFGSNLKISKKLIVD